MAIVTGAAGDGIRLDAARTIGAHEVIDVTATDAVARVRDLTGGRMADVVMDISPAVETVPFALDLVAFRGTVLLAGLKHFAPVDGIVTDTDRAARTPRLRRIGLHARVDDEGGLPHQHRGDRRRVTSAVKSSGSTRSTRRSGCWRGRSRDATLCG